MKPVISMLDLDWSTVGEGSYFHRYALVSEKIGAKLLGYNISVLPPGKKACPFHNHRINEEMVFILEGEGELRFGSDVYKIKAFDFVAMPPGGREVAHLITNTGSKDLKYIALSTMLPYEVAEYPDSDKVMAMVGTQGARDLRQMFLSKSEVDYFEGEPP